MSTRNENSSLREIRALPKPRGAPRAEGGGGGVSQCEVYGRDGSVWPGYERGYTPVILASRDGESAGGGGGGLASPDSGDSGIP